MTPVEKTRERLSGYKQIILIMDKVSMYNSWYQMNYSNLMRKAHVYGRDKDCFHDAYLAVRRFVMVCPDDVVDYTPYYIATVNNMRLKERFKESRNVYPDDFFFQCLNVVDDSVEEISRKNYLEDIGKKVMKYVKKNFMEDYQMFRYRLLGLSYREIALVLGVSQSVVRSRITNLHKIL